MKASIDENPLQLTLIVVGALTLVRLIILFVSPFNLGPDEAQYWSWSTDLAFGYFSKPPMIAWVIWLTTLPFGDGETFIRLSSPLLHAGTSFVIFKIGERLYNAPTGAWAAITFATLPSVFFSSGLITTDVPLLFFWSIALYGFHKVLEGQDLKWAAISGAAIGFGLLSKYAMVYFILCAALYLVSTKNRRAILISPSVGVIVALAFLIFSPNIIWNATAGFATFTHTASNANWQGDMFNLDKMIDFIVGQLGVFGPILFIALVVGLLGLVRDKQRNTHDSYEPDRFLLFFTVPILAIAISQAFLSRANANWAATAYVAATPFTITWLARTRLHWLRAASLALHLSLAAFLYTLVAVPGTIESTGMSNSFKRVRGWDMIGDAVLEAEKAGAYTAIMADDRLVTAELLYYARPSNAPITYWDEDLHPAHHYELTIPLHVEQGARVLFVARYPNPQDIFEHFESATPLHEITVITGVDKSRTVYLFELTNYKGRGADGL